MSVELKDPSRYRSMGMDLERAVLDALQRHGLDGQQAPVYLQSSELHNLIRSREEFAFA